MFYRLGITKAQSALYAMPILTVYISLQWCVETVDWSYDKTSLRPVLVFVLVSLFWSCNM